MSDVILRGDQIVIKKQGGFAELVIANATSGVVGGYLKNVGGGLVEFDAAAPGTPAWGAITGTLSDQTDLDTALNLRQPLDTDLTTIAGLTAANDDIIQRKAGVWINRTLNQYKTDLNLNLVENTALSTWIGSTNISTLGTITNGTWNGAPVPVSRAGVPAGGSAGQVLKKISGTDYDYSWQADSTGGGGSGTWGGIIGTLSDQTDLQTVLDGKQDEDTDLTVIAGLTASNDDFMQYKAGAWANRTISQVKTDLGLTGTNSGDASFTGESYISAAGQAFTANAVNLSGTHVTGTLAAARIAGTATNGFVATLVGGVPTWQASTGGGQFTLSGSDIYNSNAGNVLIGTTTSTGDKFRVVGSVRLDLGSDATGDIYYRDATGSMERLPVGTNGHVLTLASGLPSWATPTGGGGESLDATLTIGRTTAQGVIMTGGGTDRGLEISNTNRTNAFGGLRIRGTGTNSMAGVELFPAGTGLSATNKTYIGLFNTDFVADATNYGLMGIRAAGTDGYGIYSVKAGTATQYPIWLDASGSATPATANITLKTDGSVGFRNYSFPLADGTSNQILKTNGSGVVSWAADAGGSATTINNNANNRVITGSGTANTLEAESSLTFDASLLQISAPTGENAAMRWSDADITPSNFSTNVVFSPSLGANVIANAGFASATYGGFGFSGLTNNTAGAIGLFFGAYLGTTAPTQSAIYFRGAKWDGSTSAVALAATEKLATFNSWSTEVLALYGTGAIAINGSAGTAGQFLRSGGAGAAVTWATPFITSVTTIGATPNANGITVSSGVLNLQPASASFGGVVTTGTQTFAGAKTFNAGAGSTTFQVSDAGTSGAVAGFTIQHLTSATAANGFGVYMTFELETSTGAMQQSNALQSIWTDATNASRTSDLLVYGFNNAVSDILATFKGAGNIQAEKGSFEATVVGQGFILKSADGTRWIIQVDNSGVVSTSAAP